MFIFFMERNAETVDGETCKRRGYKQVNPIFSEELAEMEMEGQ